MSKGRAIILIIIIAITVPAAIKLSTQLSSGEQVQVDFTLKLQSPTGDTEYRAKYHWGATEIDSTITTSNVLWIDRNALAQVLSSGDLTNAVKDIFSETSIDTDEFSVNEQGDWNLFLKHKLCEGIYINLEAEGDNSSIIKMTPSLTTSFVPSSLSSALNGIGLDYVDVIVSVRLQIMGEVVKMFLWNCHEVFMNYVLLAFVITDWAVGTIWA